MVKYIINRVLKGEREERLAENIQYCKTDEGLYP